jgi:ribose 5-phosphate isomerase A
LKAIGAQEVTIRVGTGKHGPVITERGNIILDAAFPGVTERLETEIKSIIGVVDSGLFIGYATEVLVAGGQGIYSL